MNRIKSLYCHLKGWVAKSWARTLRFVRRAFVPTKERPMPLGLIIFAIIGIAFIGIVLVLSWDWLRTAGGVVESNSATIRNIGLVIAGAIALPLAIWRSMVAQKQADVAQQSLLNEQYQKGAEMLGSDVLSVRMGGIYALRRLAEDNPEKYHVQIMELLCAFVRYPKFDEAMNKQESILRTDVQDIMQTIGSRSPERISLERRQDFKLYLRDAIIRHLQVQGARLSGAWLTKADLSGAVLPYADLSNARLRRANLSEVKLWGANLSKAILRNANLSGADLYGIDARSPTYNKPVCGLTQAQLDQAVADPDNPPKLEGVLDAETGEPLVWRGGAPEKE